MAKAKSDENDDAGEQDRNSEEGSEVETDKKPRRADDDKAADADSDSAAELTPVRPKIGESKDNLRQRSERFQKRHGSG